MCFCIDEIIRLEEFSFDKKSSDENLLEKILIYGI